MARGGQSRPTCTCFTDDRTKVWVLWPSIPKPLCGGSAEQDPELILSMDVGQQRP